MRNGEKKGVQRKWRIGGKRTSARCLVKKKGKRDRVCSTQRKKKGKEDERRDEKRKEGVRLKLGAERPATETSFTKNQEKMRKRGPLIKRE